LPAEDPQAFVTGLVASHGTQLRRFLLTRVRNVADVPDIIQEIYLRMLRVPNVESVRSPEAYLFTVARHVVQQHTLAQSATPPSSELARMLQCRVHAAIFCGNAQEWSRNTSHRRSPPAHDFRLGLRVARCAGYFLRRVFNNRRIVLGSRRMSSTATTVVTFGSIA